MKTIIHKYITNEASKEELKQLNNAIKHDIDLQKQVVFYKTLNNRIINMNNEIDTDKAWETIRQRIINKNSNQHKSNKIISLRWAALVLLIIGLGSLLYLFKFSNNNQIITNAHKLNNSISLPDGTEVYLNYQSSINYPNKFDKNKRVVSVTGEAYFNVTHNASKPFIIKLNDSQIEVLGTSFNVKSRKSVCNVYVTTGKVKLTSKYNNKFVHILPGEVGIINKNRIYVVRNTNENILAWKSNSLQFKNTPLISAFETIEKAYNIKITIDNGAIANRRITTIFNNVNDKNIIKIICKTFGLSYKQTGNKYYVYYKK